MKNLLLPKDWYPGLKIDATEWRKLISGGLYAQDFDGGLGAELARVTRKSAPITIYACRAAGPFSQNIKSLLPTSKVQASISPMHFEYSMNENADPNSPSDWITDWKNDVPKNAKKARLVPDDLGAFGPVEAPRGGVHLGEVGANDTEPGMAPTDKAARIILFRLGAGSGDHALIDDGKTLVDFDQDDRDEIRKIFGTVIGHDYLNDDNLRFNGIIDAFDNAERNSTSNEEKAQIEKIEGWYKKCVDESVRLYY